MKEITHVTKRGNSLGVSITKTCKALNLVEGDVVEVDVQKVTVDNGKIVRRNPEGNLFRVYDSEGRIEIESSCLADVLAVARKHCEAEPKLVDAVYWADRTYDEPDYNPQTGEPYEGVINDEQVFVGEVYYDGAEFYIFNPHDSEFGFEIMEDGRIGPIRYLY